MSLKEQIKRYGVFIIGLFVNSFGVSFITKANLGTSPISSIPYTLSLKFTPTLGMFTLYMSLILIAVQILLLRRRFPKVYLLQIPVSIAFSAFIDLTMSWLSFMNPSTYLMRFISLLIGCLILGIGVYMEMLADVVMLPGESFVKAVSVTFHTDFGKTKVAFDSSMTVTAGILGIIFLHGLIGVREGTVVAALLVGMIARTLKRKLTILDDLIKDQDYVQEVSKAENGLVITISREYGTKARDIAKTLSDYYGMTYYDERIIESVAEETHMKKEDVEKKEQKMTNSLLYDLFAQYKLMNERESQLDKIYSVEAKIIRKAASEGDCVIVGRCADYILKDTPGCYNVFIYADEKVKIKNIQDDEGLSQEGAEKKMLEMNRKRANYHKYYTDRDMDDAKNYDLCLDVTHLAIEDAASLIEEFVKRQTASQKEGLEKAS